ncbi:uncharacterized protein LOC110983150 [Acanthaster planci]|uniref:Uncharacterized protein LOC110983150 n=1 Tax=Acanthaster planci TaxID=133434 RepID=A0A8B7YWZ1_ACAPL|nr:uncharacterized protein LOC110983150 [Acanthaster planci]
MTTMWKLMALAAVFVTVSSSILMESDLEVLPSKDEQLLELLSEELAEMTPQEIAQFLLIDSQFVSVSEVTGEGVTGKCTLSKAALSAECCAKLSFSALGSHHALSACAVIKVLKEELGIHLHITAAGMTVYNKKVSVRDNTSICVGVPKVKVAQMCLDLNDVQWKNGFHTCVNLKVRIPLKTLANVRLGCIDL